MTRRSFLAALAAALALDPERMLWLPGKKLISIPKLPEPPRNSFLTPEMILDRALEVYAQQSAVMKLYDARLGDQWQIRPPGGKKGHSQPLQRVGERRLMVQHPRKVRGG
jgi:hypothetical protein